MDEITKSWWPFIISFFLTLICAIRIFIGGKQCPSKNRMDGKIVVITGGSSGIGLETAKQLAERGAYVVLGIRNAQKGKQALEYVKRQCPDCKIIARLLDLTNFSSIQDFVNQMCADFECVDVLINNAGVIYHPYCKTVDGNETTMSTNYFGPFLLTHLLLPLLNKSDNGRIINLSSSAHFRAKIDLDNLNVDADNYTEDVFSQSKLALTMFTKHLANLLKDTKITVNAVNPGLCRGTGHLKNSKLTKSFATKLMVWPWVWLFLKTPKQASQTVLYAAIEPTLNTVTGCYLNNCEIEEPVDIVKDSEFCEKLYKKTCQIVNIDEELILNGILAK